MRALWLILVLAPVAAADVSRTSRNEQALVWVAGRGNNSVMIIEPVTGLVRWRAEATTHSGHNYWCDTSLIATRRRVFFASSRTGQIVALDRRTGRKLWVKEFGRGHIFLAAQGEERIAASGYGRAKHLCLEAATGRTLWKHDSGYGLIRACRSGFAVSDQSGAVVFFDNSGAEIWRKTGVNWPVAGNDDVLVCSNWQNRTVALKVSDGSQLWKVDKNAWTGTIKGDTLVLGGYYTHVTAVDLRTGAERWSFSGGGRANAYRVEVIGKDTVLAAAVSPGTGYALDLETGRKLLEEPHARRRSTSYHGVITGTRGRIYTRGENYVQCRDRMGRVVWKSNIQNISGIRLIGGTLLVGTQNALIGLKATDGRERWRLADASAFFYARPIR
jgi:outer membrane protein assembly factor BamB